LVLPIIAFTLSATKLEIRAKSFLPGSEKWGCGSNGEGRGKGEEMIQSLYAHMNKIKIKKENIMVKIWGKRNLYTLWKAKYNYYVKQYGSSSNTYKLQLPYSPAKISVLDTHEKECKSEYNKDTCISMFTVALFIIPN
jgi:hypothetical protein